MKVDIPNKSADKSTDTLINKAPETTKEQEKPKEQKYAGIILKNDDI